MERNYNLSKEGEVESLLKEQNKRFQVICSSKNDAIITSDETKKIVFWNKGAEYIFGYSSDEAVGQPLQSGLIALPLQFGREEVNCFSDYPPFNGGLSTIKMVDCAKE